MERPKCVGISFVFVMFCGRRLVSFRCCRLGQMKREGERNEKVEMKCNERKRKE